MHVHFVDAPLPPPSYEQAVVECRSPFGGSTNTSLIGENCGGMEISQRVQVQSELIREQEAEIGKLKRDLGKMREHVERMALQQPTTTPKISDKLTQRLANIVDEEAEERRRKNRSRKGDILRGSICCLALLVVVLAGIYVVLSRPHHFNKTSKPSVEQFKIIGKALDSLCMAQALIHPFGKIFSCNIFRRSRFEQKLFCEFSVAENAGVSPGKELRIIRNDGQKGIILIKEESLRKRREQSNKTILYTLTETEILEAKKLCTEHIPVSKISSTQTRKSLVGRWNSKNNKKLNLPTTTTN
uniref:Uncharacterized protein n=1 Tax=Meloidogyne enterolobii TaxID=390850 RepID=A0A6V7TY25_MELEN|nr:unnamed protein product [Meloidogyne enterolobii]